MNPKEKALKIFDDNCIKIPCLVDERVRIIIEKYIDIALKEQAKEIFDRLTMKLDLSNMSVINKKIIYNTRKHFIKGDNEE